MKRDPRTSLESIRTAIEEIGLYVTTNKGYTHYASDRAAQIIAERLLTVVGEAVKKLSEDAPQLVITNASRIRGLRNRL